MPPSEPRCVKDAYGCEVILVKGEDLEDFPALIEFIRKKGYGRESGILKLRLCKEDRQDDIAFRNIMDLLQVKLTGKKKGRRGSKKENGYRPDAQLYFKASVQNHIYQYCKTSCTPQECATFVKNAVNPSTYTTSSNCCSEVLQSNGLDGVREHIFKEIEHSAPFTRSLIEKEEENQRQSGIQSRDNQHVAVNQSAVLYGAGINVDSPINISKHFSLSKLGTITNYLEERYDGIDTPYLYCGTLHSSFPWQVEDGGMFSINYVFAGSPKLWFGFSPDYFGLVDCIAQSFNIPKGHTACRAFLVDHKTLVADPQYFKDHHAIPYTVVLQEPGDFIITMPFALHAGFNLGSNLAMAANFGDSQWLEEGMFASVCDCYPNQQVQLKLMPLLKAFRPDLIPTYCDGTACVFPENHPRQVKRIRTTEPAPSSDKKSKIPLD